MSNETVIGIQPLGVLQEVRNERSKPLRLLPVQKNVHKQTSNKNRRASSSSKHLNNNPKGVKYAVLTDMPSCSYASLNSMAGLCAPVGQNITTWLCKHAVKVKKICRRASVSSNDKKRLVMQKLAGEPDKNVSVSGGCVASNELRNKAYKICREFLSGSWKSISSNDMIFKTVGGGLSNLLYYCSLPETHTPLCGEPSQVLMRMYGQIHGDDDTSTITESIICTLLSERALGPKLFGVFPGGRLEEYIPARALNTEQIRQPEISLSIARKLARLHALQAPLTKEPTWLFDNMEKWLAVRKEIRMSSISEDVKIYARQIMEFDYTREVAWLREVLKKAQSPVMFCHNDLQEGNVLHMEGKESKSNLLDENLVFIDFEYCAYNYRGFDIANHFCEWAYDYSHPEYPLFKESIDQYPTEEQRRAFLGEYLKTLQTTAVHGDIDPRVNTIEHLLEEARTFTLVSHILWSLWALNSAHSSKIDFGYWEYGAARLQRYMELKELLVERLELSLN